MGYKGSNYGSFCSNSKRAYIKKNRRDEEYYKNILSDNIKNKKAFNNHKRNKSSYKSSVLKKTVLLNCDEFSILRIVGKKYNSIVVNFRGEKLKDSIHDLRNYVIGNDCEVLFVNFNAGVDKISGSDLNLLIDSVKEYFVCIYMFDTKDKRAKRNVKIYKRNHESDKEKV